MVALLTLIFGGEFAHYIQSAPSSRWIGWGILRLHRPQRPPPAIEERRQRAERGRDAMARVRMLELQGRKLGLFID